MAQVGKKQNRTILFMINTLIFDLGGVLIDWNPEYVFRELIPDEAKREYFFENICTHDWNLEQDAGRSLSEATDLLVNQFPEWEAEIVAYYGRWHDMLGEPDYETLDLLRKAIDHPDYQVLALTNWAAETWDWVLRIERFQFLHWFDGVVVSGQEKVRKPYPEIYQILLNRYAIQPETAVFTDDNVANVEAAKTHGLHGVHFQTSAQLCQELANVGVFL